MRSCDTASERERVVVLHGVGLNRWFMHPLSRRIEAAGFHVLNISYPSRTVSLQTLATDWLPARLARDAIECAPRAHFVAHSMGSMLVRHLMAHARPANAGRVVLIAPPNQGSELADDGRPRWLMRMAAGVNLDALGRSGDAFWRGLPASADFPAGVIAGTVGVNPLGRALAKPNDGTITVASTRLAGQTDAIELPFSHTGLLFRRRTAGQVVHFLRHGKFIAGS